MSYGLKDGAPGSIMRALGKWLLPALLGASLSPAIAQQQQELKFRFATVQQPGIYLDGITKFTNLVKERTGGEVQIEVF